MEPLPPLETPRLLIRPFTLADLDAVHQLMDDALAATPPPDPSAARRARAAWLQWTILGYSQFAELAQPPYGDRAVILKSTGDLIGVCGYVPILNAFEQLPAFAPMERPLYPGLNSAELGLYYAIAPAQRRRGYAAEAAQALVTYAFRVLRLRRIVATTEYDNLGSLGVMRRLGMHIERNPYPDPPWLQVVGRLEIPL